MASLVREVIGDVLRRARTTQGRTLREVSDSARVSLGYLSEVERGRKEVSSEVLAAVCDALRVDLSDLLAEVGRALDNHRAPVARLDAARRLDPGRRAVPPPARRSGDAVLLAA